MSGEMAIASFCVGRMVKAKRNEQITDLFGQGVLELMKNWLINFRGGECWATPILRSSTLPLCGVVIG